MKHQDRNLVPALVDLNEQLVAKIVSQNLNAGNPPLEIIKQMQAGME
ncbi:MAG: hypothetical protein PVG14_10045 [Anaerolineales bacterium]|jgi:hypothetical protein